MSTIFGSNKRYIEDQIPHLARLLHDSVESVLRTSEVIVVAQKDPTFRDLGHWLREDQTVVDLAGLGVSEETEGERLAIAA